jgi:hypothetical protein
MRIDELNIKEDLSNYARKTSVVNSSISWVSAPKIVVNKSISRVSAPKMS